MKINRFQHAFTLIELLIVVAIIAILAAIAVPNFLEAQVRAKVSRVKSDMRTIKTADESYRVDHNHYASCYLEWGKEPANLSYRFYMNLVGFHLTTPVAYITNVPGPDPFNPGSNIMHSQGGSVSYLYINFEEYALLKNLKPWSAYTVWSFGPNKVHDGGEGIGLYMHLGLTLPQILNMYAANNGICPCYDPTNGTVSGGDIVMNGGDSPAPPFFP